MARVLVIGGGQLGTELMRAVWPRGLSPEQFTRVRLDLGDRAAVLAQVRDCAAVINAAAYTAVDKAESEAEQAARVNRDGPAWLAEACAACGAALLHVSTDYVFDGSKSGAYTEDDPVVPLGVYGR
ncbi:MAG: NAD(P)-dependent oxidoreductase, partial [Rhodospirillales bacterium]|nr:NAD(P)-dependent oxidoreductase [Rhodospirillales bacterium]